MSTSIPSGVRQMASQAGAKLPSSFEGMTLSPSALKGFRPGISKLGAGRIQTMNLINQTNKLGIGQPVLPGRGMGPRLETSFVDINNIPLVLGALPGVKLEVAKRNAERLKKLALDVLNERGAGPGAAGNHVPGGRPVPWELSAFTVKLKEETGSSQPDKPLVDTGQLKNGLESIVIPVEGGDEFITMLGMSNQTHEGTMDRQGRASGKDSLQIAELMAILEEGWTHAQTNNPIAGFKWFARIGQAIQDPSSPIVTQTAGELMGFLKAMSNINTNDALKLRAFQAPSGGVARVMRSSKPPGTGVK